MVRTVINKQEQAEEIKSLKRRIVELEKREAEYKKYRQSLHESEQKYKLLSDNIIDIVWMMNIKTQKFDYISPSIERISGFTQREAMRLPLSETVTPVSYEYAISVLIEELEREKIPGVDPSRLRTLQLEEICKDSAIIQVEAQLRFLRDAAGIPTHVVGITRDIGERNRVEKALRDSEERFRRQAENSPDIIYRFRLSPKPTLEYFNPAVTTILGYSEEEIRAGLGFIFNLMQSEDKKIAEGIITSNEKQQQQPLTLEIKHKNGTPVWLEIRYVPILGRDGKVEVLEGIARDVTQRKLAEKALLESEERLRTMMEASSEGFIFSDGEKILDINGRGARRFGFKQSEMVGKELADFAGHESLQLIQKNIAENHTQPYEAVFQRKDGSPFPVEIRVRNIVHKDNNVRLIVFRDLTMQKQYENLLENIVINAPTSMSVIQDEKFKFVNKRFLVDTGYTEAEIQAMDIMQCVYPEDRESMTRNVRQMLLGNRIEPFEFRTVNKSAEIQWVLQSSTLITYNRRLATLSMYLDITEQKKNEAALRESEQKYRLLSDNATDVVSTLNLKTLMFDYISPSVERVNGYTPAEAMTIPLDKALTPASFENSMKILSEELAHDNDPGVDPDRIRTIELGQIHKDGSIVPTEVRLKFLRDTKGAPTHVISSTRDITERKRDEARLRQSEENLTTYINNAPAGVYICDLNGILMYGNRKAEEILGFKKEEFIGKSFWDLGVLPEQSQAKALTLQEKNAKGITTGPDEFEIVKKDGSLIWLEVTTTPITQRGVTLLIGYARDITDRKKAEEALRISEENYRNSIDRSPMGVVVFDDNEKILYANRAILDIYGFERVEELQNTPIKERYTPESYADYILRSEKFKTDRTSTSYELSVRRKGGGIRHLHAFRNEILWGGQKRFQLLYNDITDQKHAQEAMRISEENFHNSIDNSSVGIMVFKQNEDIIYANRALLDIYGYENIDELKNTPLEERYTPKTYAEYLVRH